MKLQASWRPLTLILLIGIAAGIINVLFFQFVMQPLTEGAQADEVAVSTYVINLFVGWVFFSAWFLARADDELKKVEDAIHRGDKQTFLIEAPKEIALSIRLLYLLISALVILSFHLFHLESQLITGEVQFGVGFLVVITAIFLWDLDNPIGGAVGVTDAPEDWLQELRELKKSGKRLAENKQTSDPIKTKSQG